MREATLSPDGRWVASGTKFGTGVRVWNAVTGKMVTNLPVAGNASVVFSPDGDWLMTSTKDIDQFWTVGTWGPAHCILRDGMLNIAGHGVFSPDSQLVATRHGRTQIQLCETRTGRVLASLQRGHQLPLCFSPDGAQLVTTGDDGLIQVWDLRAIRRQLAAMNLDWDLPPYASAKEVERAQPPEVIVLTTGSLQAKLVKLAVDEKSARERVERLRARVPPDDPSLDGPLVELTQILIDSREFPEAEVAARDSLALRERIMPDKWFTFNTQSILGGILLEQEKYVEAERRLLSGYDGLKQREASLPASGRACLRNSVGRLVQLYEATGQADQVEEWSKKLTEFGEND